jgi:hypothetical protein
MSAAYLLTAAYAFAQVSRILGITFRRLATSLAGPVVAAAGMTGVLFGFRWVWSVPAGTSVAQLVWLGASLLVAVAAYASLVGLVARPAAGELMLAVRLLRSRTLAAAPDEQVGDPIVRLGS